MLCTSKVMTLSLVEADRVLVLSSLGFVHLISFVLGGHKKSRTTDLLPLYDYTTTLLYTSHIALRKKVESSRRHYHYLYRTSSTPSIIN